MRQEDVQKAVDSMISELPGSIAAAVVDMESGMTLASFSKDASFDPEIAGAYNSEVIKQKHQAMKALGIDNQGIEDILITLEKQIHIIRLTSDKSHFLYLVTTKETNLAIARSVVKKQNI